MLDLVTKALKFLDIFPIDSTSLWHNFIRSLSSFVLPEPCPVKVLFVIVVYFEQAVANSSKQALNRTSAFGSSSSINVFVSERPSSYNVTNKFNEINFL